MKVNSMLKAAHKPDSLGDGYAWAFGGRTVCYCECLTVRKAAADWRLPGGMPAKPPARLPPIGRVATTSLTRLKGDRMLRTG